MDIIRSNSTLGLGGYRGGGLNIRLQLAKPYKVQFFIDSVILYGNSGQCGANFYFCARYTDYESLIINNTISTYGNTFVPITTKSAYTGAGIYFFHFSLVGNIIIENTNISHNVAKKTGGVSVNWLFLGGSFELQNCIIHNNTGHIRSKMTLYMYEYFQVSVSATQPYINLDNILFDSNQVLDVSSEFEAAIVLSNVLNVTIKQIQVNNHNTAGLLSLQSQVYFVGHSQFVNNTGIYGGGVALYESSYLFFRELSSNSFLGNRAKISGGGIFVSKVITGNITSVCFFNKISCGTNAELYFENNTAQISGDVLYGGNIAIILALVVNTLIAFSIPLIKQVCQ